MANSANFINPNGCPLSATFYVSTQYTDYSHVQRMYSLGHEIATHTMNHVNQAPLNEVTGAVDALNLFAGIPRSQIKGFRQPFLNFSSDSFQNVKNAQLLYDSSITIGDSVVGTWPYTLDNGPYTDCGGRSCPGNLAGLWEIPMYVLKNPDGSLNAVMDPNLVQPTTESVQSVNHIYNLYKTNFFNHYNSNSRLPFGIYLHAAVSVSLSNHMEALIKFRDFTAEYEDVYWINNQQLLNWIQAPTDITGALTSAALDCLMPATDPSNQEICDGIDNTGNGKIDEGLQTECYYPNIQSGFSVYISFIF